MSVPVSFFAVMKTIIFTILFLFLSAAASADKLDSLRGVLEKSPQIQEKIYIHTDNSCYFIGDTLWYKAYLLRADNLHYTDMSKIMYVELLSPDGLVVDRQRIVASEKGFTCGNFVLRDSLYSGYYELRAYTRWQLNFNVSHRSFTRDEGLKFYGKSIANDFYREWDGLYSRVLPVYAKPDIAGDYDGRYMYERPKQNIIKPAKEELHVAFYPEGGALVRGLRNRVAFEATDQNGQAVSVEGRLSNDTNIATTYMGRGVFDIVPQDGSVKANFTWQGNNYSFDLPKTEPYGLTMRMSGDTLAVDNNGGNTRQAALAVLCRGRMYHFERIDLNRHPAIFVINAKAWNIPTGICEAVVYGADANISGSRLFFVNNHDMAAKLKISINNTDLRPYDKVDVDVASTDSMPAPHILSVSVRDSRTDDHTYDDGNMMTDLLLSSELRGFIAYPGYYFASDDATHRKALDLLMMVQGWHRYNRVQTLRYAPEKTFTVDGDVFKMRNVGMTEFEDVQNVNDRTTVTDQMNTQADNAMGKSLGTSSESTVKDDGEDVDLDGAAQAGKEEVDASGQTYFSNGRIHKEVLLEAEIDKDGQSAGLIQKTRNHGHFMFQIPPFYGSAILFMRAYEQKDSAQKCMANRNDKNFANERAYPDYYVKQNLFFPIFSKPYNYYQTNIPPYQDSKPGTSDVAVPQNSKLNGDHTLQTVDVKARRRGKRGIDYTKPAFVMDTYELYNRVTDYGLSWGVFNFKNFPFQAATYLYGDMGRSNQFNIRAMLDGASFYRNYTSTLHEYDRKVTPQLLLADMMMNRQLNVRAFSDYEPRNTNGVAGDHYYPDVTFVFETVPDGGKRYSYRDRRFVLQGFFRPDEFYSPDYSKQKPAKANDYRRTLYWNPNLKPDSDGHFRVSFFNNSRDTRIQMSVAGVTADGKIAVAE